MTILPIDEINALGERLKIHFEAPAESEGAAEPTGAGGEAPRTGRIKSREDCEDIIDELLDLFLLSYAMGADSVGVEQPLENVQETIYKRIAGKTWEERVWDYYQNGGTLYDILRIASTESHRDANAAAFDAAKAAGKTTKVWHCMMLDTSRDDHVWLDGVSAPLDGYFYAPGGERTLYPGEWGVPEQDCNCLCWLTYE